MEGQKAEQLAAALFQQAQKHTLLAELPTNTYGIRRQEQFLLKRALLLPVMEEESDRATLVSTACST